MATDEPTDAPSGTQPAFRHFTIVAEGVVGPTVDPALCRPGPAFMGLKVWATSPAEAGKVAQAIGRHVGFIFAGRMELYVTEPKQPAGDKPHGYDLQFTPFDKE